MRPDAPLVVAGAGAFGTALALALRPPVALWARDARALRERGESPRLPGHPLPAGLAVTDDPAAFEHASAVLLAVPAQALRGFLEAHGPRLARPLVACGKGIDLMTLEGPSALIARVTGATPAVLTGPSFAADLARGLPTALTLACADDALAPLLQARLATPALRPYRMADLVGAELGGALKNVVAIACGAAEGAALGESARAALLARGFAEMRRLAVALGAEEATLMGLSGLGDLVLTATSAQSRNFRHGLALGRSEPPDPAATVEGVATARAAHRLAERLGLDLPVTSAVAALAEGRVTVPEALRLLLDRPLREER